MVIFSKYALHWTAYVWLNSLLGLKIAKRLNEGRSFLNKKGFLNKKAKSELGNLNLSASERARARRLHIFLLSLALAKILHSDHVCLFQKYDFQFWNINKKEPRKG